MQPKILLVDDREDNLLSMEAILTADGYGFSKARSGREALKVLLNDVDFAMILMDVKMPVLNGFETANLIREREKLKDIPIIFISANNYGDENVYKGYQSGGIDYILKPINPEVLRAKVSVFINLYEKSVLLEESERKLRAINEVLGVEINDRKASEEKVKKINYELLDKVVHLESAHRNLKRFISVAAHDLHDPLTRVATISEQICAAFPGVHSEDAGRVDHLKQAADRVQRIFLDLLVLSEITLGQSPFVDNDLNELLRQLLADMEQEVDKKKAVISVGPLPTLHVIPELMRSLFQNLISNALAFSQKDNPVIRIHSETGPPINNGSLNAPDMMYHHIFIEDNGIGFDQQYAEDIFSLFKRSPAGERDKNPGIGLALCRKIVELHHGFIVARSKVNEGATFIVSLPYTAA